MSDTFRFSGDTEAQDELAAIFKEQRLSVQRPAKIEASAHGSIEPYLKVVAAAAPVAACMVAWFKSRRRACRLFVESGNRKIEIEAGSPAEIQEILEGAKSITIERPNDAA